MVAKEQAREEVRKLVERYKTQSQDSAFVKSERQACDSLILPFFRNVLGWDTETEFKSEYVQGGKRMDYLVHIDGISQFVVEAKSLSQEIVDNRPFYEQVIHYARQKERRFCVLTNFRHWIVLDANIETEPLKAAVAVIDIENLSEADVEVLWSFQRAVWEEKGEANETLLKLKGKQKRKISEELLDNMKRWREQLLTNLKKHPRLNNFDFASDMEKIEGEVQRFIDRLIFICYCEDRQLSDPQLKAIVHEKNGDKWDAAGYILRKIRELFQQYDSVYNSDLFAFGWCDEFHIEDVVLMDIINGLKAPPNNLPYDFGVIEADVLGKAYENFLGHILSGRKKMKEKESRGKRKEEGIYYTPAYIVEYIVKNTLGELLKTKELADLPNIRVLDPACGSGSFLIKAFEMMDATHKKKNPAYSTAFMKNQILKNNIFGVDLDAKAVEIARFNLMLRAASRNQSLPKLKDNIKCGNSLIDDPTVAGDKAFKWEEQFSQVMTDGGFDVVIGNPPYFNLQKIKSASERNFFTERYDCYRGKADIIYLFIERAMRVLKDNGCLGFIVANYFLRSHYADKLRKLISDNCFICKIIDFGSVKIFQDSNVDTSIIILKKSNRKNKKVMYGLLKSEEKTKEYLDETLKDKEKQATDYSIVFDDQTTKNESPWNFCKKEIKGTVLLRDICYIGKGAATGKDDIFVISRDKAKELKLEREILDVLVDDSSIDRYNFKISQNVLVRTNRGCDINKYKKAIKYLEKHKKEIEERYAVKKEGLRWFEIVRYNPYLFSDDIKEQIYAYYRSSYNKFAYSNKKLVTLTTTFVLTIKEGQRVSLKYLLGILNSKSIQDYTKRNAKKMGACYEYSSNFIGSIPIKVVSEKEQTDMVGLVDKMLSLNKRLSDIGAKKTAERERIEEDIRKTDTEIDELVYKLYGITDEEKKIIEESLKPEQRREQKETK